MKVSHLIFTSLLFYFGWFGCIFLARTTDNIYSLLFPVILFMFLILSNNLKKEDLKYFLGISIIGIAFDFLLINFGLISVIENSIFRIPLWLISIWLLYSLAMIVYAQKIRLPTWLAVIMGAVMGPLSYKSGEYFRVLMFSGSDTIFVYAFFWALMFPLSLKLPKRSK